MLVDFIETEHLLPIRMSRFRKGHSTVTTLIDIRDDIIKAMSRGEITIMVLADFSKAYNTIHFDILIKKLRKMGFSHQFLRWIMSYLTERQQYVQVDDTRSEKIDTKFGVPQGSILGPVLFNLYFADLSTQLETMCDCHQYVNDTTVYTSVPPTKLQTGIESINSSLRNLASWSEQSKLALNNGKIKALLITTPQMASYHSLREPDKTNISITSKTLNVIESYKLLGIQFTNTLNWNKQVHELSFSCYASLAVLRKLGNIAPFHLRKQLGETLILSKLDYCDIVFHPLSDSQLKRLQRVQCAATSFDTRKYSNQESVLKLGWLPLKERRDWHLATATFKALHDDQWPNYLRLEDYQPWKPGLRSKNKYFIEQNCVTNTFKQTAAKLFNSLSLPLRSEENFKTFYNGTKKHFIERAKERIERDGK